MNLEAQLQLVDEVAVEVLECADCGHPAHGGPCEVLVEVLRGRCAYGLAYVGTGPCSCTGSPAEEVR